MRKGDDTSEQNSKKGTEEKPAVCGHSIFNANCDPKHSDAEKNLIFQAKKNKQMGYLVTSKWKHIFVSCYVTALQSFSVTFPSQYQPIAHENMFFLFYKYWASLKGMCAQEWKPFLTFLEVYVPFWKGNRRQKKTNQIRYETFKHITIMRVYWKWMHGTFEIVGSFWERTWKLEIWLHSEWRRKCWFF